MPAPARRKSAKSRPSGGGASGSAPKGGAQVPQCTKDVQLQWGYFNADLFPRRFGKYVPQYKDVVCYFREGHSDFLKYLAGTRDAEGKQSFTPDTPPPYENCPDLPGMLVCSIDELAHATYAYHGSAQPMMRLTLGRLHPENAPGPKSFTLEYTEMGNNHVSDYLVPLATVIATRRATLRLLTARRLEVGMDVRVKSRFTGNFETGIIETLKVSLPNEGEEAPELAAELLYNGVTVKLPPVLPSGAPPAVVGAPPPVYHPVILAFHLWDLLPVQAEAANVWPANAPSISPKMQKDLVQSFNGFIYQAIRTRRLIPEVPRDSPHAILFATIVERLKNGFYTSFHGIWHETMHIVTLLLQVPTLTPSAGSYLLGLLAELQTAHDAQCPVVHPPQASSSIPHIDSLVR